MKMSRRAKGKYSPATIGPISALPNGNYYQQPVEPHEHESPSPFGSNAHSPPPPHSLRNEIVNAEPPRKQVVAAQETDIRSMKQHMQRLEEELLHYKLKYNEVTTEFTKVLASSHSPSPHIPDGGASELKNAQHRAAMFHSDEFHEQKHSAMFPQNFDREMWDHSRVNARLKASEEAALAAQLKLSEAHVGLHHRDDELREQKSLLSELHHHSDSLQKEVRHYQEEGSKYEENVHRLTSTNHTLRTQLEKFASEYKAMKLEWDDTNSMAEEMARHIKHLTAELVGLRNENLQQRRLIEHLQEKVRRHPSEDDDDLTPRFKRHVHNPESAAGKTRRRYMLQQQQRRTNRYLEDQGSSDDDNLPPPQPHYDGTVPYTSSANSPKMSTPTPAIDVRPQGNPHLASPVDTKKDHTYKYFLSQNEQQPSGLMDLL